VRELEGRPRALEAADPVALREVKRWPSRPTRWAAAGRSGRTRSGQARARGAAWDACRVEAHPASRIAPCAAWSPKRAGPTTGGRRLRATMRADEGRPSTRARHPTARRRRLRVGRPVDRAPSSDRPGRSARGDVLPSRSSRPPAHEGPSVVGQRVALDSARPSRLLIGQSSACDVRIADSQVSRRHCAVRVSRAGGCASRILDSKNGHVSSTASRSSTPSSRAARSSASAPPRSASRRRRPPSAARPLPQAKSFGRMIGASAEMRRLYPLCARLAAGRRQLRRRGRDGDRPKRSLRKPFMKRARAAAGPFIVFDCTAVPPNLVESELFGHEARRLHGGRRAAGGRLRAGPRRHAPHRRDRRTSTSRCSRSSCEPLERSEVRRVGGDRPIKGRRPAFLSATRARPRPRGRGGPVFATTCFIASRSPASSCRRSDAGAATSRSSPRTFGPACPATRKAPPPDVMRRWQDDAWPGNVRPAPQRRRPANRPRRPSPSAAPSPTSPTSDRPRRARRLRLATSWTKSSSRTCRSPRLASSSSTTSSAGTFEAGPRATWRQTSSTPLLRPGGRAALLPDPPRQSRPRGG